VHTNEAQRPARRALTVYETADRLSVSPRTIWMWIAEGRLAALRLGPRTTRIPVEALDEFLRKCRSES
jgi:excisionase family DNA binding protein